MSQLDLTDSVRYSATPPTHHALESGSLADQSRHQRKSKGCAFLRLSTAGLDWANGEILNDIMKKCARTVTNRDWRGY